ncbi:MAG: DUF1611 domain-containing protein [Alphaproteobacteria bacterium]|nr:DUF1611 domain-containing protein [Alphaproteobacteria bacterium]
MKAIEIRAPYLIFLGRETQLTYAKTGSGLVQWRAELCKGQMNLEGGTVDLGLPQMTVAEAKAAGIQSLVIGTAAVGGEIPEEWLDALEEAVLAGLDIVAGVHTRLCDIERLAAASSKSGARLVDVRIPPARLPVGSGKKRTGKRLLMVGTDCAVGKKYTALQMEKDMKRLGWNADFRASGQTGIMIAGHGLPIDSVVSDFLVGAAELLSPDNSDDHWDVIEGQGGIFHPGYCAVSMGLLIGSQPDAFVVCHEAGRETFAGWEGLALPSIQDVIERTTLLGQQANSNIACVGVSVNTSGLPADEREAYLAELSSRIGLPCVDPLIDGTDSILAHMSAAEASRDLTGSKDQ